MLLKRAPSLKSEVYPVEKRIYKKDKRVIRARIGIRIRLRIRQKIRPRLRLGLRRKRIRNRYIYVMYI